MKSFFRLLLCAAVLCALAIAPASAAPARPDEGFTISNFDVQTVISENNVYSITEVIKVNFSEAKHGLIREIPINQQMARTQADGTVVTSQVTSSVTNVSVPGYKFSVDNGVHEVDIKIGDANKTITGPVTYRISYKLRFGDDRAPGFDEVYYNIIGTDWDTTIDHATFSVTYPKPFDASKLGFSIGREGKTGYAGSNDLTYSVAGNTVTGTVMRPLKAYEGLTMRTELPQGYFMISIPDWILIGLFALMALVGVILMLLYGVDKRPLRTVEFYPPEGLTPAEIGFIYNGSVDDRDAVSLLMYFADKGYLKIEEADDGGFKLTKLKDLGPEARDFEKHMFENLFKKGPTVTTDELEYKFYKTMDTVKLWLKNSFDSDDRRIYTKKSLRLKPWLSFLAALPMMFALFLTLFRVGFGYTFTIMIAVLVGLAVFLPLLALISTLRNWHASNPKWHIPKLLIALIFCAGAVVGFLYAAAGNAYEPALPWAAAASAVIIGLCAAFISKRTPKGVEWIGKIDGFKDFIVLAERDKLIALVEQNPNYFYNVLPYAYVLNVTDIWANKFESIAMTPPSWYISTNHDFRPSVFATSLNSTMGSFQTNMTATRDSGGSGGGGGSSFSGGGFSGGGGGGGGGSSW